MKTLIMVRHAKSSWNVAGQDDFDRALNERGKRDAVNMAGRLLAKNIAVDAFISSPAKRAKKTAESFVEAFGGRKENIILLPALYLAAAETFAGIIKNIDDAFDTVAVFSHNPGITGFVNTLSTIKTDDMPTCSLFAVCIKTVSWKDFENAEKEYLFYDYPKLIQPG